MSNIQIHCQDLTTQVEFITFSDNAETCKVNKTLVNYTDHTAVVQLNTEDVTRDLIRVGLVKDALDRLGFTTIKLSLSYIPQARADRVFEQGLPLPIKVFADILNSFNFHTVYVDDPHSDVGPALINNCKIKPQHHLFFENERVFKECFGEYMVCAPDLGATKKTFDLVQLLGHTDYVQAIKVRDVTTGDIIKCDVVENNFEGKNVVIVDDLCDGGASFKFLAQKLKQMGAVKVGLFVSHGIFSKGLEPLEKEIDKIVCCNITCNYINRQHITDFNNK